MAYATASEFKTYAGVSTAGDDALIADLLDAATEAIDKYTRRTFAAASDTTRYFDAWKDVEGRDLWLDEDLCAITTVTNGDSVEVTSAQYTTVPKNETPYYKVRLLASSGVGWTYTDDHEDAITILGKWAYSTTAPDDVHQACLRLASFYYRVKDSPLTDVTAIEAGTVIQMHGMPPDVKALLGPYRKL